MFYTAQSVHNYKAAQIFINDSKNIKNNLRCHAEFKMSSLSASKNDKDTHT